MNISIIISYYKALNNLGLILEALNNQSCMDFEVILSEDDYNPDTISFISNKKHCYNYPIQHIYQEKDIGFRKNMMLNRAVQKASTDMIVFIDGDCIPHTHFAKEYIREIGSDNVLIGRRVMLGEKFSSHIITNPPLKKLALGKLFLSDSKNVEEALYMPYIPIPIKIGGILGCNWGIKKKHLLEINGFDEDYKSPGVGEDTDIGWRLEQYGLKRKSMKNRAIVYHIYHPRSYTSDKVYENYDLFDKKKQEKNIRCLNGIESQ